MACGKKGESEGEERTREGDEAESGEVPPPALAAVIWWTPSGSRKDDGVDPEGPPEGDVPAVLGVMICASVTPSVIPSAKWGRSAGGSGE